MTWLIEPKYKLMPTSERILEFKGLNRKPVIDNGEMRDMKNLSSDEYPCLSQRRPRGIYRDGASGARNYRHPIQMLVKYEQLAVMDEGVGEWTFWYAQQDRLRFHEKQKMIGMNEKIIFFPDKSYYDCRTGLTGKLEAELTAPSATVDSSNDGQDNGVKVTLGAGGTSYGQFKQNDAVVLTGVLRWTDAEGNPGETRYPEDAGLSCLINSVDDNVIVFEPNIFLELDAAGTTTASLTELVIKRECPNLSHVMEYGNRLWGTCDDDNTIRCCKMGDPTNWDYYQNEALDSWAATQGTEGAWTGCAAFSNHLLFFKENYIHKVYGSYPAQFQVATQEANGVEIGSADSVAIIEDYVFYKSRIGIMVYAGSRPEVASGTFGANAYRNVVAGANRRKYYASMERPDGEHELLVFDAASNLWHREDDTHAVCFCFMEESLLYAENDGEIWIIDGGDDDSEIEWYAELGPFDEYLEDKKVVSKLKARYTLEEGAYLDIFIKTDDSDWRLIQEYDNSFDRAGMIRIVPQRCNKYSVRFEGKGRCRIESLVRLYRQVNGRY